jgi:tripartite ATP-independent transporter DctM subunit
MSPELIGGLGILLLLILFSLRMQIGLAMLIVGFVGFIILSTTSGGLTLLGMVPYATASAYGLSVIPLFMLMGMFLSYGGLGRDIFEAANAWLGHVRGGMALATIGAIAVWSAISGSATATAASIGSVVLPEMKRHGYSDALATACVAAGGTLDILIPPSSVLVLYGILTEESIGKLLIAGILPGILLAFMFGIVVYIWVRRNPKAAPVQAALPMRQRVRALRPVWAVVVIFLLVMGGIYKGWFTPTEAAAVGAFISLLISLISRRFKRSTMSEALDAAARTTAMLFFILIGAIVFSRFLAVTRIPFELSEWIAGLNVSRYVIIGMICVLMVILGCFIEGISLMVLTIPILYPLIINLGFDGVWFGILFVTLLNIGMVTPPVGINVYVTAGVAKDVPLMTIFRGVTPFWITMLVGCVLFIAFPQIALWLVSFMK